MTLTIWAELCNKMQEDCITRISIFTQSDGAINHAIKTSRLQNTQNIYTTLLLSRAHGNFDGQYKDLEPSIIIINY